MLLRHSQNNTLGHQEELCEVGTKLKFDVVIVIPQRMNIFYFGWSTNDKIIKKVVVMLNVMKDLISWLN